MRHCAPSRMARRSPALIQRQIVLGDTKQISATSAMLSRRLSSLFLDGFIDF